MRPNPSATSTGTMPVPVSSRTVVRFRSAAITAAVPSTGCPANGSSLTGVKMRTRASAVAGSVGA
jgi:hypothetical protein